MLTAPDFQHNIRHLLHSQMDGQTNIMIKLIFKNKLTGCFYRLRQCSGSGVIMASSRDVVAPFLG